MTSILAVAWTWKVALGVLGAAALVWFLLAAFVARRWPALHPALGKLRTPPARMALVGVLAALVVAAAFASRPAYARSRSHDEFGRRRSDRRLVMAGSPDRSHVVIHTLAAGLPHLTMVHVGSPCAHGHADAEADVEVDAGAEEARRDAEEQAREAEQEARERAQERVEQAQERARERAEEARARADEAAQRAQEIAEREMERAQAIMERLGDEMTDTRDAVNEGLDGDGGGDRRHARSKMESFLEGQAEKVERLGREMAEQLRGLASRFGDGDDDGEDHDDDRDEDSVDL